MKRRSRKVGNLRMKNHQSTLGLRDAGYRWLVKAAKAAENARALFALADKRERDEQKAVDDFYARQEREARGETAKAEGEVGFMIGHLGRGGRGPGRGTL